VLGSHHWPERFEAITPDHSLYMINPDLQDVPDIDAHRDDYRVTARDMEPGDVLVFHPLVVQR
jgi:ectoine hydroxylase-related dioxygenase (phytanoyl-CoA dioxygenase family)